MIINAIILEDTQEGMQALKMLLATHCPKVKIIGTANTNEEAYQLITEKKPQLAFLDINLERGTSFDLLNRLHEEDTVNFEFIFFTSHDIRENFIKAIRFSAFDFFTKPVDKEELIRFVERLEEKIYKQLLSSKEQLEMVIETLSATPIKSKRIAFQVANGIIERPEVDNILWLQTKSINQTKVSDVTQVFLKDGKTINAMKHLGHYKKLLTADYHFFPISQSILVNMNYATAYNPNEKSLLMEGGQYLYASKRGSQKLRQFLSHNPNLKHLLQEDSSFKQLLRKFLNL